MEVEITQIGSQQGQSSAGLAPVIMAVGDQGFGRSIQSLLAKRCSATYSMAISLDQECPSIIWAESADGTDRALRELDHYMARRHWIVDPAIYQGHRLADTGVAGLMWLSRATLGNELGFRLYGSAGVADRLVLVGRVLGSKILIALTKSSRVGNFTDAEVAALQDVAHGLLAATAKHASLITSKDDFLEALTSLKQIELLIGLAHADLTGREAEVCARILYGISTAGIALDLKIGEETVMTYRKRAYQRLGIGSQRELLLWYVTQWARIRTLQGAIPSNDRTVASDSELMVGTVG